MKIFKKLYLAVRRIPMFVLVPVVAVFVCAGTVAGYSLATSPQAPTPAPVAKQTAPPKQAKDTQTNQPAETEVAQTSTQPTTPAATSAPSPTPAVNPSQPAGYTRPPQIDIPVQANLYQAGYNAGLPGQSFVLAVNRSNGFSGKILRAFTWTSPTDGVSCNLNLADGDEHYDFTCSVSAGLPEEHTTLYVKLETSTGASVFSTPAHFPTYAELAATVQ